MGVDWRHDVVSSPGIPTPEKVRGQNAEYVLLHKSQVAEFTSMLPLRQVATYPANGEAIVSLWKLENRAPVQREEKE